MPTRGTRNGSSAAKAIAASYSVAPTPHVDVGQYAEHGSLRVIRFWIGQDEFALLSVPDSASRARSTSDGGIESREGSALTAAENAVMELVISGLSNRAIGERRGTSPSTIANQLAAIYKKLGLASRAELALWHLSSRGGAAPRERESLP